MLRDQPGALDPGDLAPVVEVRAVDADHRVAAFRDDIGPDRHPVQRGVPAPGRHHVGGG